MTYFGFLFRFLIIPIFFLLAIYFFDEKKRKEISGFQNGRAVWLAIAIHIVLALTYTTPWDNYLVATGVWYYNPQLVTGIVLGYVPIEEYTFFILETLFVGLWWWMIARRYTAPVEKFRPSKKIRVASFIALFIIWIVFTALFFSNYSSLTYLSIIFFWALPAIIPQILFGADILWHHRKLIALTILPMGIYLSIVDSFAIADSTWTIAPSQSTGILLGGVLPVEEAAFFFITVTLISFGMTLFLTHEAQERIQAWRQVSRKK